MRDTTSAVGSPCQNRPRSLAPQPQPLDRRARALPPTVELARALALALALAGGGCGVPEPSTYAAGTGGAAGGATARGSGGSSSGSGGASAGSGGASAGTGGASTAGTGGASTGSGGASTGTGGAPTMPDAGAGDRPTTGSGGAPTAGTGGRSGAGGGGSPGSGGATAGSGGAPAGTGGATQPRPLEVWVAPNGNDANPGTADQPMLTLCDTVAKAGACYKLCPSSYSCPATGATIWVKGGNYRITRKIDIGATRPGVAGGVMNMFAVAGEKPVLDASGAEGGIALHIKASYWHVKGLEIKNAPLNCVKVEGGNNTIESMVVHSCGNTGITISRYGGEDMSANPGSNNTILNCDSYANVGPNGNGEDADGFGAKESSGTGNVFRGCRAWNNADDGFDFYGWANPITIEDGWAFENAKMGATGGDGNGFKLGPGPGKHVLRNCIAANNVKRGYTCNGADGQSTCTNCRGCSNAEGLNDTGSRAVLGSVTNLSPCVNLSRVEGPRNADGTLPAL